MSTYTKVKRVKATKLEGVDLDAANTAPASERVLEATGKKEKKRYSGLPKLTGLEKALEKRGLGFLSSACPLTKEARRNVRQVKKRTGLAGFEGRMLGLQEWPEE